MDGVRPRRSRIASTNCACALASRCTAPPRQGSSATAARLPSADQFPVPARPGTGQRHAQVIYLELLPTARRHRRIPSGRRCNDRPGRRIAAMWLVGRVGPEPTTSGWTEARPGAPEALPARISRSRAADGPDCTVYTDGSVHEPVHADRSITRTPATERHR
jgi:hypothetical protein